MKNAYFDQLERSGHANRIEDLDRFASLGIRAIRYPVLWERTAPNSVAQADFSWADQRLLRLRALGVRPIVGLLHHGSGPSHTSLVDVNFPGYLAEYAGTVAKRYPWVDAYTPINEPLTTARFSGLYGFWYPHGRDLLTFARALLNQCRATIEAMRAIRAINPVAQLVQTEDLGKTHSTPHLAYQAAFENERRWITWDLLSGNIHPGHAMWDYLRWIGILDSELNWFRDNPCPPDIIGINYYVTSERFLDERVNEYPTVFRGGNGTERYADLEAVRARAEPLAGLGEIARETWDRYQRPIAITESHLHCTREEQIRWLAECWAAAKVCRSTGIEVCAVTVWSLLGAFNWNSLVTRQDDQYESGVFDVRSPQPRETALAGVVRALAADKTPAHPVLASPGWWRRPSRLLYTFSPDDGHLVQRSRIVDTMESNTARPILVTGATGTLGRAFARICGWRGLAHRLVNRQEFDITAPDIVRAVLDDIKPWAVINTSGYVRVDDAENEPERCMRENAAGPAILAEVCASRGVRLVTFSSDMVFDGQRTTPYLESTPVSPLNVYGRSKAEAERRVLDQLPGALVIRTSSFFGPWDEYNFVTQALRTLAATHPFLAPNDVIISATYVPDLVHATLDLLIDEESGIWHLTNVGAVTWFELAARAAMLAGVEASSLSGQPVAAFGWRASRPPYGALGSERASLMPTLDNALERYCREGREMWEIEDRDRRETRLGKPGVAPAKTRKAREVA